MARDFSYTHYLESKRSVDDRAINRPVLDVLRERLPKNLDKPLRVLELGGGTGSMVRRCVEWSILQNASYTLIDQSKEAIDALPDTLEAWAEAQAAIKMTGELTAKPCLEHKGGKVEIEMVPAELSEFLTTSTLEFDLVIANAVLDLVDLDSVLPLLWTRCAPGALFWFTINFDGESVFLPALADDAKIFEAYHGSMEGRYAGRSLFRALNDSGARLLQSGSSDWVVHGTDKGYEADEGYFLHHIVHTIDEELQGHPNLNPGAFSEWIDTRHQHVDKGELVYIAHQLDFVGLAREGKG